MLKVCLNASYCARVYYTHEVIYAYDKCTDIFCVLWKQSDKKIFTINTFEMQWMQKCRVYQKCVFILNTNQYWRQLIPVSFLEHVLMKLFKVTKTMTYTIYTMTLVCSQSVTSAFVSWQKRLLGPKDLLSYSADWTLKTVDTNISHFWLFVFQP